jgi:hypothetical protein
MTLPVRPLLILYLARYSYAHKNAVAATLAWLAESRQCSFEVYYDAPHSGRHYGGGDPRHHGLELLTGGLMTGGRHLEALALVLQRFQTTVVCTGRVAFSNTLAALADSSGANVRIFEEDKVANLYSELFSAFHMDWPDTAVMVDAKPSHELEGIDAYCYPEIFFRRAVGIEASANLPELRALQEQGIVQILTCGVSIERQASLRALGFEVCDLNVIRANEDFGTVTARLARQWHGERRGWLVGDPTLVSYMLPAACRDRRAAIYSVPQSRVISMLENDIAVSTTPILGRQSEDKDFFDLSRLGQSFQLVDPCRPPLGILQTVRTPWASDVKDPESADPTDEILRAYAREGRVLASLVFWTGMIRETENLFALMDLFALTGLRAGIALTSQSFAWRPSPLDLLTVPRDQGGVFPNIEVLLASCGNGAAIESLLPPGQLGMHLHNARKELECLNVPQEWWPKGWWATMDVPMQETRAPSRVRGISSRPFVQMRYRPRDSNVMHTHQAETGEDDQINRADHSSRFGTLANQASSTVRDFVRESRFRSFFAPYRPYESFAPGSILPSLCSTIKEAGFSYMLTKSGFGLPPKIQYCADDFVALNYTAGQWDGWTPFETVNDVRDLRRAEKTLLADNQPGWLLGCVDACLWAFSGESWTRAPRLLTIAEHMASGGSSGKLINVPPRVLPRYARIISNESTPPVRGSQ